MDGGSDHAYAVSSCVWGTDPEPLLKQAVPASAAGGLQVLDAGCGEGRNAAYLASAGAVVRALDVSPLAIEHARATWGDIPGISWEQADLRDADLPDDRYDLVVIDSVLHWLADGQDAGRVLGRLRGATRLGGRHLLCVFNDRHQELGSHHAPPRFIPAHDWCLRLYDTWAIEALLDETIVSSHPGAPWPHGHSVTKLLARRPPTVA
jgi:SAM-dependent methyltransferase